MRMAAVVFSVAVILGAGWPARAGEIVFRSGQAITGRLVDEALVVASPSGVLDIPASDVAVLTPEEIRLKDGRLIRGTLVSGRVKVETGLGEIIVKTEDLGLYRADGGSAVAPGSRSGIPQLASRSGVQSGPETTESGAASGLPSMNAYQGVPPPPVPEAAAGQHGLPSVSAYQGVASTGGSGHGPSAAGPVVEPDSTKSGALDGALPEKHLEVVTGESPLYRDAYSTARQVGRVTQGEQLVYLDFIDRRLRIMNTLVFNGGYWIKVRATDGTEGWLPGTAVRAVP